MARVTGPLMSMDASGQLGGAMVFSKWKGRPYVRQLVIPANPKSDNQIATRAMMAFLSTAWATVGGSNQETWAAGGDQKKISAFNHYTSVNMARWTQFQSPSKNAAINATDINDVLTTPTATPGTRQVQLNWTVTGKAEGWGVIIHVGNTTSLTGAKAETKLIFNSQNAATGDPQTAIITGLDPGTYDAALQGFTDDGVLGTMGPTVTFTVL